MGAWGAGSFENDSALDWLAELRRGEASLEETLRDADSSRSLDVDGASAAVAAAELVAESRGQRGFLRLPKDATGWLAAQHVPFTEHVVVLAHRAVARVLASSELQKLWDQRGPTNDWRIVTQALLRRLALAAPKRLAQDRAAAKQAGETKNAGASPETPGEAVGGPKKPGRKKKPTG